MIAWPRVPAALLALLPSVWTGVRVYDGEPVPNPPSDRHFVTVGFVDGEDSAGTFNQEVGTVDGLRDESGEVRCELVTWVGQDDPASVRADALSMLDVLDSWLRENQTLDGALGGGSTVVLGGDFVPRKSNGTAIRIPFSVQYFTRSA